MKRLRYLALFVIVLWSIPAYSSGSVLPSSVSLDLGYTKDLGPHYNSFTAIPGISATWPLGSRFAIRSSAAYIQERRVDNSRNIALGASGNPENQFGVQPQETLIRSNYIPLTAGLRFYAGQNHERTRGLFLDAAPAIYLQRLTRDTGGTYVKAPLGLQLGAGIRVPVIDGSRLEVGMTYHFSNAVNNHPDVTTNLRSTPAATDGSGLDFFSLHLAIGYGD